MIDLDQDLNFVAIDFESANDDGSACQVGMARVISGEIVETTGWDIIPPTGLDSFNLRHIGIHGITPERAASGWTWDETVEAIADFVDDLPLFAHQVSADRSIYKKSCDQAGVLPFEHEWQCTLALTRHMLPNGPRKLHEVAAYFGIDTSNLHDAKHDAIRAAAIVLAFAKLSEVNDPTALRPPSTSTRNRTGRAGLVPHESWFDRASTARKDDIPQANPNADPGHPLYGHHFVITNQFPSMDRWDAWVLAAKRGAQPEQRVTKKTTMVVLAHLEEIPQDYDPLQGTGTERKAGEHRINGEDVQFIAGSHFLSMLHME